MTYKKILSNTVLVIVGIMISISLSEIGLRILDPDGTFTFFEDLRRLNGLEITDVERMYVLQPGVHTLSGYTMTITNQHTRYVPGVNYHEGACRVAFVGDSYTMATGVDDEQVWVSLLAQDHPDLKIINAGKYGYNTEQVTFTINNIPADFYVYLFSTNDNFRASEGSRGRQLPFVSAVVAYFYPTYYLRGHSAYDVPSETFDTDIERILNHPDVITIGFETDQLAVSVEQRYPGKLRLIPAFSETVSRTDFHAGVIGNQEIAAQVSPLLTEWATERCPNP